MLIHPFQKVASASHGFLRARSRIIRYGNPTPSRRRGRAARDSRESFSRASEASMDRCVHSRSARPRHDQLVDGCALKVLQQRWHIIVNAVFLQSLCLDQFLVVSQTADVHANLDASPHHQPVAPGFRSPITTRLNDSPGGLPHASRRHDSCRTDLPPPQHELKGSSGFLFLSAWVALSKAPAVDRHVTRLSGRRLARRRWT